MTVPVVLSFVVCGIDMWSHSFVVTGKIGEDPSLIPNLTLS